VTRYELLERIGVGGMAEIFRGKAVAAGGFEKPVAIKRILPHLSQDKRFVELLIAEAKVLSLLKHRNIVQIFDVGIGDDGQYFLVMEHVDGKDLGAVQRAFEARRRRMPFDLALYIGAEICEALEHAHTARAPDGKPMMLVHRDVSPSNVLLSRAGETKLTDFGIAKRAEQEATGHGAVRGKFAYISPEQARNEQIDPRSDVFSVGILLWELIVNRRLFSGLGDLEALRAVRDAQVPRPAEADPRLPPEIDQLLMSALDRDQKRRPTAGELGAKLRSIRYSLEVTAGDPATELARIIDTADEVQRESQRMMAMQLPPKSVAGARLAGMSPHAGSFDSDHNEATVIRIRTADDFQMRDQDVGMARAREVIGRFDEEETRQAQISGDQLRILRGGADSSDVAPLAPAPLPGIAPAGSRTRRSTDEPTSSRPPLYTNDVPTIATPGSGLPPELSFDSDERTRLLTRPRDQRTPPPQPLRRPPTAPPPLQPAAHDRSSFRARGPTPAALPHTPLPAPLPAPQMMQPPPQGPMMPQAPQMMQQPPPQGPMMQPPPQGGMPGGYPWGGAPPLPPRNASQAAQDMYDQRPVYPQRASLPGMGPGPWRKQMLKPWMLIAGALVMAVLAFVITRAFLS
jgi:serine/threonine protein kinase